MSRYVPKYPRKHLWPSEADRARWRDEPLAPGAARVLAEAVVAHAMVVDMEDPRRTLPVFRWVLTVLPDSGPLVRRRLLPRAIETAERVLRGEMGKSARRHGRKLKPHHRAILADLVRQHHAEVYIGPPAPALVSVLDL